MKQIIECTKIQFSLAVRLPYFWISMFIVMLCCAANNIYFGISYYGYSAIEIKTAGELTILNDINPFWTIFSTLIPFICMFPFSMQPLNDKEKGTRVYLLHRVSNRTYYMSGIFCSAVSTFLIICLNMFLSVFLSYIMFGDSGETYEGSRFSNAYIRNIKTGYSYHFQWLNTHNPLVHIILMTIIFSLFCSILAAFFYAAATLVKKDKLVMMLIAGIVSFAINQIYYSSINYSIYGDVTASAAGRQTGFPTIALCGFLIIASIIIITQKIRNKDII